MAASPPTTYRTFTGFGETTNEAVLASMGSFGRFCTDLEGYLFRLLRPSRLLELAKCVRLYSKHTVPLFHFDLSETWSRDTHHNLGQILKQISAQSQLGTILIQRSSEVSLLKNFRTHNVSLELFFLTTQCAAREKLLPMSETDTTDQGHYHRMCHKHAFQASEQSKDLAVCDLMSEACSSY
jgi:hypothetical protein